MAFNLEHFRPTRRQASCALTIGPIMGTLIQLEAVYKYQSSLSLLQYCAVSLLMGCGIVAIVMLNPLQRSDILRQTQQQAMMWAMMFFFRTLLQSFYAPATFPRGNGLFIAVVTALIIGIGMFSIGAFLAIFERQPKPNPTYKAPGTGS